MTTDDRPTLTRNRQALIELAQELHREADSDTFEYNQHTWGELSGNVRVLAQEYADRDGDDYRVVQPLAMCTSHACLAGTAVMQAGYRLLVEANEYSPGVHREAFVETSYCLAEGEVRNIADVALERLGLHRDEASLLFDGAWRPARGMEAWEAIDKLASGARLSDVTAAGVVQTLAPVYDALNECPIEIH